MGLTFATAFLVALRIVRIGRAATSGTDIGAMSSAKAKLALVSLSAVHRTTVIHRLITHPSLEARAKRSTTAVGRILAIDLGDLLLLLLFLCSRRSRWCSRGLPLRTTWRFVNQYNWNGGIGNGAACI